MRLSMHAMVFVKKDKYYGFVTAMDKEGKKNYVCVEAADKTKCWYFGHELHVMPKDPLKNRSKELVFTLK